MPIADSTGETLDAPEVARSEWFFDRPYSPDEIDLLADSVAAWLCSDALRWLVEHVPGRREPDGPIEPLEWPLGLCDRRGLATSDRIGLAEVVDDLQQICDWARPGTAWDYRVGGERPLGALDAPPPEVSATAVGRRAAALGLCSHGRLHAKPRTLVVLGGRRMAPLNRARAAARALRAASAEPATVILLSASRTLDRSERESPEVQAYAAGARTEADLMLAAARRVFGADIRLGGARADSAAGELHLVEVPAPDDTRRASTYETLRFVADELAIDATAPVGLVTSPTCRPFQHLDAVRALGLDGLSFELIAHPRSWAAPPGSRRAAPHVYLQEIRSTVQAAGRLVAALSDDGAIAGPGALPAALA